jgi:hypothetical protein
LIVRSIQDCIASLLEGYAPAQVLVICDSLELPATDSETARLAAADAPAELAALGRFDFAVVADLVETLEATEAQTVLGRLKNLHADRFVLVVDPVRSSLGRGELLALALAPYEPLEDERIAWLYDIDRYNPEREWNNPEDWAHPENFLKYRW